MTPATLLDPATIAVDQAIEVARYDQLDPADLAAVIAGLRELFWHTTTLVDVLVHAYDRADELGHDNDGDPLASVTTIIGQLHTVTSLLTAIDTAFDIAHNHAAHLRSC